MKPWWPRRERLEWELQALATAGYSWEVVSGDPANTEELHLRVPYPREDPSASLDVYFPLLYPYFRFRIEVPDWSLNHHQDPLHKNLCLIGRPTKEWSLRFTLADFLETQVPKVVKAGETTDGEEAKELEDTQAEPITDYFTYEKDGILVIDGSWQFPDALGGTLLLGFQGAATIPVRAFVLEVKDSNDESLHTASPDIRRLCNETLSASWIRIIDAPGDDDPRLAWESMSQPYQRLGRIHRHGVHDPKAQLEILVGLLPEEHAHRDGSVGDGWLPVRRARPVEVDPKAPKGKKVRNGPWNYAFVRAARCGPSDYRARVPEMAFLAQARVCVFGLGCIGSVVAHEMAQAGVGQMFLADRDHVDPASTVRWPLGAPVYGRSKVGALKRFLESHYPFTKIEGWDGSLGAVLRGNDSAEWQALSTILGSYDLIVDATAEHGVQRFLSAAARATNLPYVWVYGTPGGRGGLIADVRHGDAACWACVETALHTGDIPRPLSGQGCGIQPLGCGDPTFTGASFDMHTLALAAARTTVAVLAEKAGVGPVRPHNVEILGFRDEEGTSIRPTWETYTLPRSDDCRVCGPR